jgi:hypothetical protein
VRHTSRPETMAAAAASKPAPPDFYYSLMPFAPDGMPITLDELTRRAVREAIRRYKTHEAAAAALGMGRRTVARYLSMGRA